MVQTAVRKLSAIAPQLTDALDSDQLAAASAQIDALIHPLQPDDIRVLVRLLPPDGDVAAGLNWTLLHTIEAAPVWPMWDLLDDKDNEWVQTFLLRLANAGITPPADSAAPTA